MKTLEAKNTKDNSVQVEKDKALMVVMQGTNAVKGQEAFAELYKRYKSPIFFEVLKYVRMNKEIAQDLVQEIFTKAFINRMQYDFSCAFSTWLYSITKNHIIDHKRKVKVEVLSIESIKSDFGGDEDFAEMAFQLEDKSANTFNDVVRKQRAELVNEAIQAIKSKEARNIIEFLFIKDMAYDKVAEEMKMPIGTLKAIMFRAKDEMKKFLSKKSKELDYGRIITEKKVWKSSEGKKVEVEEEIES